MSEHRTLPNEIVTEEEARKETICRGCFEEKDDENMLCCWHCFKRRDTYPLKYFPGSFAEWQWAIIEEINAM